MVGSVRYRLSQTWMSAIGQKRSLLGSRIVGESMREGLQMKKLLVLAAMHLSVLCAITVFIFQHNLRGWDAAELYLSYFPIWLVNYKVLETPQHRGAAIASCIFLATVCLTAAFYYHAYFLIFAATAICAIFVPLLESKQATE